MEDLVHLEKEGVKEGHGHLEKEEVEVEVEDSLVHLEEEVVKV